MTKRNRMLSFKLNEISAVDSPAQAHALMTIIKRNDDPALELAKAWIDPADGARSFSSVVEENLKADEYWEALKEAMPLFNALDTALRSIAGDSKIDRSTKLSMMRDSIATFFVNIGEKIPDRADYALKRISKAIAAASGGDPSNGNYGGKPMPDDVKKQLEELTAKVSDLTAKVADAEKARDAAVTAETAAKAALEAEKARGKMSDDEKEIFDSEKDETKKAAFLAMAPEVRKAEVAKRKAGDETLEVNGHTIFKSKVGDDVFAFMKSQAQELKTQAEKLAKANEEAEVATFAKRASDELSHSVGTDVEKAVALRAISKLDEPVRKSIEAMLHAGDKMAAGGFTKFGHGGSKPDPSVAGAQLEMNKKIDEIAKRDGIGRSAAMQKARQENPDLFKTIQSLN